MTAVARSLVALLRDPARAAEIAVEDWTPLLAAARAERLLGSLALRIDRRAVPAAVAAILADADQEALEDRRATLWEAEMTRRALAPLGVPVVLLKGAAYAAAGLAAGGGRMIGDLDILVPRTAIEAVELALRAAGWEAVKEDAYDDAYYRRWMHELPPLIHAERDRMIDVHHTILPPTARPTPDAAALLASAVPLGNGLSVLAPADMIVHAAAHLFADGDLDGGLRNLWDIDRLLRASAEEDTRFWPALAARAARHQLSEATARAVRLSARLYGTAIPAEWKRGGLLDGAFVRRLLVRDGWGRQRRPATRLAFYIRSHWLRMPPHLLARHLAVKALRRR